MRYVKESNRNKVRNIDSAGSIHRTGSVTGMQRKYGWPKGGQIRLGSYIYNVGVREVERLRDGGLLLGE